MSFHNALEYQDNTPNCDTPVLCSIQSSQVEALGVLQEVEAQNFFIPFVDQGTLTDEQVLHATLRLVVNHLDAKLAAQSLVRRYGTLGRIVKAPGRELAATVGVGLCGAALLKAAHMLMLKALERQVIGRHILACWDDLMNYLKATFDGERIEAFRVLFIGGDGVLIANEEMARGTINGVMTYPREVVRRSLELDAVSVILVHNHPSGDLTPSPEDVQWSAEISRVLAVFDIKVIDHVVVGESGCLSLRMEKLLGGWETDDSILRAATHPSNRDENERMRNQVVGEWDDNRVSEQQPVSRL